MKPLDDTHYPFRKRMYKQGVLNPFSSNFFLRKWLSSFYKWCQKKYFDSKISIKSFFVPINVEEDGLNNNRSAFTMKIWNILADYHIKITALLFIGIVSHLFLAYYFGITYLTTSRTVIKWRDNSGNLIENAFGTETWEVLNYCEDDWLYCPSGENYLKSFKDYSTVFMKNQGWVNISHEKIQKDTTKVFHEYEQIDCLSILDFGVFANIIVIRDTKTNDSDLLMHNSLYDQSKTKIRVAKDYYINEKPDDYFNDLNKWYDIPDWITVTYKNSGGDTKTKKFTGSVAVCISIHNIYFNKCIF